jgi:hypothetical protein
LFGVAYLKNKHYLDKDFSDLMKLQEKGFRYAKNAWVDLARLINSQNSDDDSFVIKDSAKVLCKNILEICKSKGLNGGEFV